MGLVTPCFFARDWNKIGRVRLPGQCIKSITTRCFEFSFCKNGVLSTQLNNNLNLSIEALTTKGYRVVVGTGSPSTGESFWDLSKRSSKVSRDSSKISVDFLLIVKFWTTFYQSVSARGDEFFSDHLHVFSA